MHLTTVKLSFNAYLLFVISCFINAILHVEVVEREILHSATSGPINSIGVRANTADALEDCNFFFFLHPACRTVISWAALTQQSQRGTAEVNSQVPVK